MKHLDEIVFDIKKAYRNQATSAIKVGDLNKDNAANNNYHSGDQQSTVKTKKLGKSMAVEQKAR